MIEKHVDQGGHVEYIDPNETRIAELEADNERLRAELDDLQQAGQVVIVNPLRAKVEGLRKGVLSLAKEIDRPSGGLHNPGLIAASLKSLVTKEE